MTREEAIAYRRAILKGAPALNDEDAVTAPLVFPRWDSYDVYTAEDVDSGLRVVGDDLKLYRVISAHTRQDDWKPSVSPTLFELVEGQEHAGTIDDPIPAAVGLRYYKDKYYSEGEAVYLCIRQDTEDGTVLYYMPSQLVGNYFEEAVE